MFFYIACLQARHALYAVVEELRGDVMHSCSVTHSTSNLHAPPPQSQQRPAFSAVVVERLDVKEIGEFVSRTPRFFTRFSSQSSCRFCTKTAAPAPFLWIARYASCRRVAAFKSQMLEEWRTRSQAGTRAPPAVLFKSFLSPSETSFSNRGAFDWYIEQVSRVRPVLELNPYTTASC